MTKPHSPTENNGARAGQPEASAQRPVIVDPLREPQDATEPQRLKRAWLLILMTLVLPGSAQVVAGNRHFGRLALRISLGVWGALLLLLIFALGSRSSFLSFATHPAVLVLAILLLVLLAIGWVLVWINTFRMLRLGLLGQRWRPALAGVVALLMFVTVGGLGYGAYLTNVARGALGEVFANGRPPLKPADGRYNIALLGGDAGEGRTGLRPDSMSVISIDAKTGASAVISVPRSLQYAKFPTSSPMHKIYPDGFNDCEPDPLNCLLNAVYTDVNTNHTDAYPGAENPGAEATKDAIAGTLGIEVQAYALIDMDGFASLIDAMGGVNIRVGAWVPISGDMLPGSDTRHGKPDGWIPPGNQHLNGFQAQWFARSRENVDDFARVRRQQCVQEAMLRQLDPGTVVSKFEGIAKAGSHVLDTDIPQGQLGGFIDLALKAKKEPMVRMTVGPPDFPSDFSLAEPDFALIHSKVQALLASASGTPSTTPKAAQLPAGAVKLGATTPGATKFGATVTENGARQPALLPVLPGQSLAAGVRAPMAETLPPDFPLDTKRPDGVVITAEYLNSLYDAQDYATLDQLLANNGNCATF